MKNAGAKDQVEEAVQRADVRQAHSPEFKIGEILPLAKTIRMSEAGLGKIDTEDGAVRVVESDQSRLGRAATGAQYAQVLSRSTFRP